MRMYTHLGGGGSMKAVYETFDPIPLIDLAQQVVAKGYTALKVGSGTQSGEQLQEIRPLGFRDHLLPHMGSIRL